MNNNEKLLTNNNLFLGSSQYQDNTDYSHRGKNCHSKNRGQQSVKELDVQHLKPDLNAKIKEEFEKSKREQQILLKDNKQTIIEFLLGNKNSIRVEDLKVYEPVYKCYIEKGHCCICKTISNIMYVNCNNNHYNNNKEIWLCINHWQQHTTQHHQYIE